MEPLVVELLSYQFRNVRPYPIRNVLFRAMFGGRANTVRERNEMELSPRERDRMAVMRQGERGGAGSVGGRGVAGRDAAPHEASDATFRARGRRRGVRVSPETSGFG